MLKRICNWLKERPLVQRFARHHKEFKYIWALIFCITAVCALVCLNKIDWEVANTIIRIILCIIAAQFLLRPMNAVYGLMGTSGSIRLFFFNFLFITALFAGIYYWAFFKDAGISYDVNQPHIDYSLFAPEKLNDATRVCESLNLGIKNINKYDTLTFERQIDTVYFKETIVNTTTETLRYQSIDIWQVWRSSILTTLTQEPADLFMAATVHNAGMESTDPELDKQKSALFEWILILHIIISWIFFGVFISLLYSKFRYES